MTENRKFKAIKGVRDILPTESSLWNHFEQTARDVFESFNYREIRLPIFEQTELFARSVGVDTDIVGKEIYTFEDRPVDLGFPDSWASFETFVEKVAKAYADGEIPRTIVNGVLVHTLKQTADEIRERRRRELEDLEDDEELDEIEYERRAKREQEELFEVLSRIHKMKLGDEISLRPEATASVVRAYIEHGMHTLPGNVKLYYIGPMFRRERPQKGRYRQFYQIGAEVLGASDAPAIDAELIEMLLAFFTRVGLSQTTLSLNSIGCKECRPKYVELLRAELKKVVDKLGPDSQRRIDTNPLRVLDSKLPEEQPIIEKLPRISDHLCGACREHFAKVQEELKLRGIAYEMNWRLVRGLDYYTRTTFEVVAAGLGSQNAVCGGGRYDGLVELLGGPPTKGIGFAIGSDRAILSLQETGKAPALRGLDVFVAWMGANSYPTAVRLARKLRGEGLSVEVPPEDMKFKKSIGLADKLGARYALIIGEDEVASQQFTLKRLADGEQKKLAESELVAHLRGA
jgi:histidyl-tRNA synthetase